MRTSDLAEQLGGKRLTTAEVLYYLPDAPRLIQTFSWQTLDLAPDFPRIHQFLAFWRREIDAVIHSVNISAVGLVSPARVGFTKTLGTLH